MKDLKKGVLFCLLSSKRPLHELLEPSRLDHRRVFETQFGGMTDRPFTYEMFEATRNQLIDIVRKGITEEDSSFLINFTMGEPVWFPYDFSNFPGVQWKLLNIHRLRKADPAKHRMQIEKLESALNS